MLVSTDEATNILANSADLPGLIVDLGEGATQHGHYYGKSASISMTDSKTELGKPTSVTGFVSQPKNLDAGTTYYFKAYISDGSEIVFGKVKSFTTLAASLPDLSTTGVTAITRVTATSGGNITADGGAPIIARGVCWNTTGSPTIDDSKTTDETGTGIFSSNLSNLIPGTVYYVRAYATNSTGTSYGMQLQFSTDDVSLPTLTTAAVTNITETSATGEGTITDNGGSAVTASGVCWGTTNNPVVTGSHSTDGNPLGTYTSSISGLTANTTYYVRAYATNSVGTAYGNEVSFTTSAAAVVVPTLSTTVITAVTATTATSGGDITSNGGATVTASGVCWSTTVNPIATGNHTTDVASVTTGAFTSSITGLTANTKYYVRAFATNDKGTAYGDEISFTTLQLPTAITEDATLVTNTTVTLNGTVNATNLSTTVTFEYGTSISYGNTTTATPNPVTGENATSVNAGITELTPGTTYHFRVKAVSSGGISYGNDLTFTTLCTLPTAFTNAVTNIGATTATLNGTVNASNFSTTVIFEYGTDAGYGSTIAAVQSPLTGSSNIAVSAGVTGLTSNITYHYRVIAENCRGITFGADQTFTPLSEAGINDTLILCYSLLKDYIQLTYLFDAVYANNITAPNSTWTDIYQHTQNSNNAKVLLLWSDAYDIIYKTNFILNNTGLVIADQQTQNLINAQAKVIRSYLFYNLMIWFGDIPLETGSTASLIARNSIAEVLVQIQQDANDAYQYLPQNWSAPDEFRMPQTFAKGILTRVTLFKQELNNTVTNADEIINAGIYSLSIDTNNFSSTNSEIFWGFDKGTNTEFNNFFTKGSYVPAIRFTETLLCYAEAKAHLGDLAGALEKINMLNIRRGEPATPFYASSVDALEDIYRHWKTELVKEGNIFITLKRFNKATSYLLIADYKLLLPVPMFFLDNNPNLIQNVGY